MEDLTELLLEELKGLYSAEKQIVKALPRIIRGAESEELKSAIQEPENALEWLFHSAAIIASAAEFSTAVVFTLRPISICR